jgi:hypothetical protein
MRDNKFTPRYPDTSATDHDRLPTVVFLVVAGGFIGALLHVAWSVVA